MCQQHGIIIPGSQTEEAEEEEPSSRPYAFPRSSLLPAFLYVGSVVGADWAVVGAGCAACRPTSEVVLPPALEVPGLGPG